MIDPSTLTDGELREKYPRFAWKLVDTRKLTMTEARRRFQYVYEALRPKSILLRSNNGENP